jgi:hypothetical protein
MMASIVIPKFVSSGVSVCRTNDGQVVLSAHDDNQRIVLEISDEECARFARDLLRLATTQRNEIS